MIELAPFENLAGMAVLKNLDPNDLIEAQLMRGGGVDHLDIFSDWRAMQAHAVLSLVLKDGRARGGPFAVLALGNTGQAGVAQAALLARDHKRFRRPLAEAALRIRAELPQYCAERGIHRIEARCWHGHPTASKYLEACGFRIEVDMRGFGRDGRHIFRQFAWVFTPTEGT